MRIGSHVTCFRWDCCSFIRVKFLWSMVLVTLLAFGCSSAKVHVSSRDVIPKQDTPQVQTDSPELDPYYPGGGEANLGNLAEWLAKERGVEEDVSEPQPNNVIQQVKRCHKEELVGMIWLSLPEPQLIEDPLHEDRCMESAYAWCAPDVEDEYLAYLEQGEKPKFGTSIFPNFVSPIDNGLVLRGMQLPGKGRRGHYGLDIIPASLEGRGIFIKAVEDGVVVKTGRARGYGYYIVVYHQNGLFSLYSHLLKDMKVKVGQNVQRGEAIARMGRSGNARGYHLHFELIDLRENWDLQKGIDEFIEELCCGCVKKQEFNRFSRLLFSKKSKKDPLMSITGLAFAKRVNGKLIIIPISQINSQMQTAKEH